MPLVGRVVGLTLLVGGGVLAATAIVAAPRILRASRPFVREALRRGLNIYDNMRGAVAELADDVEDLVAEVRAEALDAGKQPAKTPESAAKRA